MTHLDTLRRMRDDLATSVEANDLESGPEVERLDALTAVLAQLTLTDQPPTEAGRYWFRRRPMVGASWSKPAVVRVVGDAGDLWANGEPLEPVDHAEWSSGPILEPTNVPAAAGPKGASE